MVYGYLVMCGSEKNNFFELDYYGHKQRNLAAKTAKYVGKNGKISGPYRDTF